jgi:hypothetical protein
VAPTLFVQRVSSHYHHEVVPRSSKTSSRPTFVTPMAAESVAELPEGADWLYELKLDGSPYSVTVSAPRNDERDSSYGRSGRRVVILTREARGNAMDRHRSSSEPRGASGALNQMTTLGSGQTTIPEHRPGTARPQREQPTASTSPVRRAEGSRGHKAVRSGRAPRNTAR